MTPEELVEGARMRRSVANLFGDNRAHPAALVLNMNWSVVHNRLPKARFLDSSEEIAERRGVFVGLSLQAADHEPCGECEVKSRDVVPYLRLLAWRWGVRKINLDLAECCPGCWLKRAKDLQRAAWRRAIKARDRYEKRLRMSADYPWNQKAK